MSPSRLSRSTVALFLLAGAASLGGCYTEGGPGMSLDQHVYVSRPWQPWTVTLRDTRTGQEFWSMDVPVGKRLAISFSTDTGTEDKYTPDKMNWALVDEEKDMGFRLTNSLPVPPANSRRLEPTLRTAPELPESMVTVTKGTLPPAKIQKVRPPSVTVPAQPPEPPAEGEGASAPPAPAHSEPKQP
ncbi:MAG TPA: hypothetical protein PKE29_11405 [Phycisphaerales bacterium]|nr:hypothetical protein [Phycisphaerales bacterium]